ncbi:MAG: hypothetical protein ACD_77C00179G0003 [uncultured bacterium]|nr:MAG: hypothetical protein ACD_77C00179G0003 [uncultured bacterium]HBY01867.1 hypothetical protein [Rikenellaceae bacterium]
MRGREKISKSHARGVVILIFIVLIIQTGLFVFNSLEEYNRISEPAGSSSVNGTLEPPSKAGNMPEGSKTGKREKNAESSISSTPFNFDPNTIDMEGLKKLGLSRKEAQVIVNYRSKGGKFRKSEDLSKIYLLTKENYNRIKDYAVFNIEDNKGHKDSGFLNVPAVMPAEVKTVLDLNSADSIELVSLPGIGPYFARKIIDYRERLGGFAQSEQLMEIYGIDKERFSIFCDRVWADRSKVSKIKLSEASAEDLSRNPYIGAYIARSIVKYRESLKSDIITVSSLVINKIIKEEVGKILEFYLE